MQGDTMSSGRIHVQQSFREFARALKTFWLVESWFLCPVAVDKSQTPKKFAEVTQKFEQGGFTVE